MYLRLPGRFALLMRARHGMNGGAGETTMATYPILFNQTPDQLRRIGARGGRTRARNWHARQRAALAAAVPRVPPNQPPVETTPQAIASLDAQFPWLYRAEKRCGRR